MKTRLFVSHLPTSISDADIRYIFNPYGKLLDVYIPTVPGKNIGKGIAFVELETEEKAEIARSKLNKSSFQNQNIYVDYAKERKTLSTPRKSVRKPENRRFKKNETIDTSLFIHKAVEQDIEKEYIQKHSFSDFNLNPTLMENIQKKGYVKLTPIQDQVIPHVLKGEDVVGIANTGTGKTGAFLIPLIEKLANDREKKVLIIVPTRELAIQIKNEFVEFSSHLSLRSALCIGGANIKAQIDSLKVNPNIVIGTPGRIEDIIRQKKLYLNVFNIIVLDEVDRMLDMGFIKVISSFISMLPKDRQSLFFSATISNKITPLMNMFLKNPITISVKSSLSSPNVDQDIVRVKDKSNKIEQLHNLLISEGFNKVLIFGKTKRGVEKITIDLQKRGFKAVSIHGDKSQFKRQKALQNFKSQYAKILVATDVAARGLDIDDVTHVINYDLPETYDDYVHRIGRTGRANKKGVALTFID